MDLAIIGSGVWVKMDGSRGGGLQDCHGRRGCNSHAGEKSRGISDWKGSIDENLAQAGQIASTECHPISDVRASAEYRTDMIRVFTKRALKKALEHLA